MRLHLSGSAPTGNRYQVGAAAAAAAAAAIAAQLLSHKLAALPNLVHLTVKSSSQYGVSGFPIDASIIAAGANAKQLTCLQLA